MVLRMEDNLWVEGTRNHPAEVVEQVRRLLTAGAEAHADPHRRNFYELQNGSKVYYVHVSPVTGKVLLLGVWPKQAQPERAHAGAA